MSAKMHAPPAPHHAPAGPRAQQNSHAARFFQKKSDSGHFFRRAGTPTIQQQVVTGAPGDRYEREADTVAERATASGSMSSASTPLAAQVTPLRSAGAQSKAEDEVQARVERPHREDEMVQSKSDEDAVQSQADEEPVQSKAEEEAVQSQADEEPVQSKAEEEAVQSQADEEPVQSKAEEEAVQSQADEEPVQSKAEEEAVQSQADEQPVQSKSDEDAVQSEAEEDPVQSKGNDKAVQSEADEEPVQSKGDDKAVQSEADEEPVQSFAEEPASSANAANAAAVQQQIRSRRGQGLPLPETTRSQMEVRFGADFSGVRIHTDDPAVQLTRLLNAHAFTQGGDIFFNSGRFAPGSSQGQRLLAHELTHTIQQGAVSATGPGAQPVAGAPQLAAEPETVQAEEEEDTIQVRPELLEAVARARSEIGKVNAKKTNADGTRMGWERLDEYFRTAFGGKEVIHPDIIKYINKVKDNQGNLKDTMPSWCGIFVWWAFKQAGIPIADWKLGESILGLVKVRPPNELPRKGDIAYREKNQHFALVSGTESPSEAAGKSVKSTSVATINGNTSGEDNLGGQVEEKWEPVSRWLGFFDPVVKLGMPPVPLVNVSAKPDEATFGAPAGEAAEAAAAKEETPETQPTDVTALEEGEVVTPAEEPAEGEAEVALEPIEFPPAEAEPDLELPPLPEVPPAEPVPEPEPLPLEGSSDEAMVEFTDASPSQMAATEPALDTTLDARMNEEQQSEVENAPVLVAQTSGVVEGGLTPPDQIPVPGDAEIGDGVEGEEPGALEPGEHENFGETPTNAANEKKLDDQEEGSLIEWLRANFSGFMNAVKTKDSGLNTEAGDRPNVQLEGEADPGRIDAQREDAQTALVGQRDNTTTAFKNHPGQKNIQPKKVNEETPTTLSAEPSAKIEMETSASPADYVDVPIPADVRTRADELLEPQVDANMAEAKTQTETAADQRDTDKETEIKRAEDETAKLNAAAETEQRDAVVAGREEVARQQGEGIKQAYGEVNEFNSEADKQQVAGRKEIGDKVKSAEGEARDTLDKAEKDADDKKAEGEKEAAAKKEEMEKEQEDQSWWDRVASAIKKAVKALTKAIDFIFTKIRDAVKFIIEKARELAVKAINAAREWVVDKLNKIRDGLKSMVNEYLAEAFPELAAKINKAIDTVADGAIKLTNMAADGLIAGVNAIAKGLTAALDKILQVFQTALKAAVQIAGAVLTGDFAEALRIAIQAACDIAGIDSQPIFDFIDRAAAQLLAILKEPGKFFNNLFSAVAGGVELFVKNIKKHLITGIVGWLTGALSEVAITIPETFDLPAVFSLAMQILGLTYENIKARVIKKFPQAATVFTAVETGFTIVKRLVTEGPIALWDEVKASLSNLKEIVLAGIREFVITTVIKEGVTWLLSLLNPAAAIVKLLKLVFDFIMFLIERFEQIKDFVMSVYNSLSAIASGSLGAAIAAVEDALARGLPVVISLIARLAGLGGIGKTVKDIIAKVAKPINKGIDFVVGKIVAFARRLLKKMTGKGKGKDKTDTISPEDATKHRKYADEVVAKLKKAPKPLAYGEMRKSREKEARSLEKSYQKKLKKGIRIAISFAPVKEDIKDKDIDFVVRIAPNTTIVKNAIQTAGGALPPELEKGKRLERKSTGEVLKVIEVFAGTDQIQVEFEGKGLQKKSKLGPYIDMVGNGELFITSKPLIPLERYLPPDLSPGVSLGIGFIRLKIYEKPHKWTTVRKAKHKSDRPKIIVAVRAVQAAAPSQARDDAWKKLKTSPVFMVIQSGVVNSYDPAKIKYEVDHEPDIALEWNRQGYDSNDTDRKDHVVGPGRLRLITKEANQAKPKHPYRTWVGPKFESAALKVPIGSKTILGKYFQDKSGKPIT